MKSPGEQAMSIPRRVGGGAGEGQLEEGSEKVQLYSNRAKGSGGRSKRRGKVQPGDRW